MNLTPERSELLSAWCDGRATDEQVRKLDELLRTDADFRRAYLAFMDQHATLALSGRSAPRRRLSRPGGDARSGLWIGLAAAAAVALFGLVLAWPSRPPAAVQAQKPGTPDAVPMPAPVPTEQQRAAEKRVAEMRERLRVAEDEEKKARDARESERLRKAQADLEEVARKFREAQADYERTKAAALPELPRPAPAEKRDAPETRTSIATLDRADGPVLRGGAALKTGDLLFGGDGLEAEGAALLAYADGTQVELAAGSRVRELTDKPGKGIDLLQGVLTADVRKQPPGRPMVVSTPHAVARVLGTRFTLLADAAGTRLEVTEGRVRLTRSSDQRSVEVAPGHFAVSSEMASRAIPPKPSPFVSETFQDGAGFNSRWEAFRPKPGAALLLQAGRLEITLAPRPNQITTGEARTRATFRLPLRVSAEVEWSHPQQIAGVSLMPPGDDNRDGILVTFSGDRYHMSLGIGSWGWRQLGGEVRAPGAWPRREAWSLEAEGDEAVFRVDGREVLRRRHGGKLLEAYHVRIEGSTTEAELPRGNFIRYDNVVIERPR